MIFEIYRNTGEHYMTVNCRESVSSRHSKSELLEIIKDSCSDTDTIIIGNSTTLKSHKGIPTYHLVKDEASSMFTLVPFTTEPRQSPLSPFIERKVCSSCKWFIECLTLKKFGTVEVDICLTCLLNNIYDTQSVH